LTPQPEKEFHLTYYPPASSKQVDYPTCLGGDTESRVAATVVISGSPANHSATTSCRRSYSKKATATIPSPKDFVVVG
jgi:hypothetical protein